MQVLTGVLFRAHFGYTGKLGRDIRLAFVRVIERMKHSGNNYLELAKWPVRKVIANAMAVDYHLGNYREVIWLVGDGRSGTTWVSDLINWKKRYREMFEPFHPRLVKGMEHFALNQYLRPDDTDSKYTNTMYSAFSGRFRNERVDSRNLRLVFYCGLLIKDIFANLLIGWVNNHLPEVKKVFIIRNPFAVALSKRRMKNSIWMTEPREFLKQKALCDDHIQPFEDVIASVGSDYVERQVMIWAIIHYVPFKQLSRNGIYILFYEELYSRPEEELLRLFSYLGGDGSTRVDRRLISRVRSPSRTAGKVSNIVRGDSPIAAWKSQLSAEQIDKGLKILERFGLQQIYGTDLMPTKEAVDKLLESNCRDKATPDVTE